MKSIWEVVGTVLLIILAFVLVINVAWAVLVPILMLDCNQATKDIGLPHRFMYFNGCQVQENGIWMPLENWRYFGNE